MCENCLFVQYNVTLQRNNNVFELSGASVPAVVTTNFLVNFIK